MKLRIEVKNEILGDSIFWEGAVEDLEQFRLKNVPAYLLAKAVAKDGIARYGGMWYVSVIEGE